jgi:hypothetical protein
VSTHVGGFTAVNTRRRSYTLKEKEPRYPISGEDRKRLQSMIKGGRAPARELTHARILLKADESEHVGAKLGPTPG